MTQWASSLPRSAEEGCPPSCLDRPSMTSGPIRRAKMEGPCISRGTRRSIHTPLAYPTWPNRHPRRFAWPGLPHVPSDPQPYPTGQGGKSSSKAPPSTHAVVVPPSVCGTDLFRVSAKRPRKIAEGETEKQSATTCRRYRPVNALFVSLGSPVILSWSRTRNSSGVTPLWCILHALLGFRIHRVARRSCGTLPLQTCAAIIWALRATAAGIFGPQGPDIIRSNYLCFDPSTGTAMDCDYDGPRDGARTTPIAKAIARVSTGR